jgi:BirA family transcriptional regulator, biotin operon repressor / biotin---[acetyl-CoA-carboxylase] ligase
MSNRIGEPFIELPSVDSTNIYAMQQAHARLATPGTVYFAHEQTAGKGQRSKSWQTEKGKNLIMSAVIRPPVSETDELFALSAATAVACCEFLKSFAGDETAIKWPNDIYWNDRKAGGILIENIILGRSWEYAIIGIGMNINQTKFDPSLPNPVSLKQITGKNFNIIEMAKGLCRQLEMKMDLLQKNGVNAALEDYNACLYKKGQEVRLEKNGITISGILSGVNKKGELLLKGKVNETVAFGTAQWLL